MAKHYQNAGEGAQEVGEFRHRLMAIYCGKIDPVKPPAAFQPN